LECGGLAPLSYLGCRATLAITKAAPGRRTPKMLLVQRRDLEPFEPFGSLYQRVPEAYSLSVGLSLVRDRLGSMCAQATCIALIAAIGATYEFKNEGLTTGARMYASQ